MNREARRKLAKKGTPMSTTPLIPTAKVMLDKERTLRMDLNALIAFENMTGQSILRDGIDLKKLSSAHFLTLLWTCLVHEDESLLEREVGAMIGASNLIPLTLALIELFKFSMPEAKEDESPLAEAAPAVPQPKNSGI